MMIKPKLIISTLILLQLELEQPPLSLILTLTLKITSHPPGRHSFFLGPISEDTYAKFVLSIKPKTSTDVNGISTKFIQSVIHEIKTPLTHVFNLSMANGTFPNDFKTSKSIPILKAGDKTDLDNYRFVSLINNFSKPIEKIMCSCLLDYLESNNFFL